jgi:hypothetical protein
LFGSDAGVNAHGRKRQHVSRNGTSRAPFLREPRQPLAASLTALLTLTACSGAAPYEKRMAYPEPVKLIEAGSFG